MTHRGTIQRAELNLRLSRGLELKQSGGEGLLLGDQVVPIVTLEDLTKQNLAVEPSERRAYMCTGPIAAVVGQNGFATVQNPAGSGALIVIRGFNCSAGITMQTVFGIADPLALPPNPVVPWWNDPRTGGIPFALCRQGTDAVLHIVTELTRVSEGGTTVASPLLWPDDFGLVLVEGQAFGAQSVVANQPVTFSFIWDEIPLR